MGGREGGVPEGSPEAHRIVEVSRAEGGSGEVGSGEGGRRRDPA